MIVLLGELLGTVGAMAQFVAVGGEIVVNAVIAAAGALLALVVGLFPSLPDPPAPPDWLAEVNWAVPVAGILAELGVFVALFVAFLAIRAAARWVKAL